MPPDSSRNLVIGLVAENENGALAAASEGLGLAFAAAGYRYRQFNLMDAGPVQDLLATLKRGEVLFGFGYAGVGCRLTVGDNVNLWTGAQTPFAALWYDHPAYNYQQHIVDSPYVLHCYHVRDHFEARQKHLPSVSSRAVLLPPPRHVEDHSRKRPLGQRERAIMYAKTALQPQRWSEDWKRHPPALQRVLNGLAEQATRDRNLDLADTAKILFAQEKLDAGNLDLFMGAVQEVDAYIRAWRSDRLARALLPHPAHIIGRDWDYLKTLPHKAEIMGPIPAGDYASRVLNYRIIANSNPLWRDGIHERAVSGIMVGAVTLTDRTVKSDEAFGGLPNYIGFDWHDDLQDVIAEALKLADKTDADYSPAGDKALSEKLLAGHNNYIEQLIKNALQTEA